MDSKELGELARELKKDEGAVTCAIILLIADAEEPSGFREVVGCAHDTTQGLSWDDVGRTLAEVGRELALAPVQR